ncbi:MAG: helix-turn-helix domain-containing protein [Candidatus Nanohaloarchaea archaeon]|nr:helix-turn-helix domain-containing protein [Candidatus Nanohaloarchaea archaeon]
MKPTKLRTLFALRDLGPRSVTARELAEELDQEPQVVSQRLGRYADQDWVDRTAETVERTRGKRTYSIERYRYTLSEKAEDYLENLDDIPDGPEGMERWRNVAMFLNTLEGMRIAAQE